MPTFQQPPLLGIESQVKGCAYVQREEEDEVDVHRRKLIKIRSAVVDLTPLTWKTSLQCEILG